MQRPLQRCRSPIASSSSSRRVEDGVVVVRLDGDADLHTAPILRRRTRTGDRVERKTDRHRSLGRHVHRFDDAGRHTGRDAADPAERHSSCGRRRRPARAADLRADAARPCARSIPTVELALATRGDGLGGGGESVVERVEDRYEPVERGDLEHATRRLRRCHEGKPHRRPRDRADVHGRATASADESMNVHSDENDTTRPAESDACELRVEGRHRREVELTGDVERP